MPTVMPSPSVLLEVLLDKVAVRLSPSTGDRMSNVVVAFVSVFSVDVPDTVAVVVLVAVAVVWVRVCVDVVSVLSLLV